MADSLLLTPYFQTEVGLVFYRIPPNIAPSAFGERTLLSPAPLALQTAKSGKVADVDHDEVANCPALAVFAKSKQVRKQMSFDNAYLNYVRNIQTCQCRDGVYCHTEKTVVEVENGFVCLCWHHDRLFSEGEIKAEQLADLADQNWEQFIAKSIRSKLKKPVNMPITYSDLVFWACLNNLLPELDGEELRVFMGLRPQLDLTKESSIGAERPEAMPTLRDKVRPLLSLKVDPEPLASFLAIPKLKKFECRKWLQFVKSQPCVCCGRPADDPHHIIGYGGKMGGKAHDLFTIPLCRIHHDELHRSTSHFEQEYGSQLSLLYQFLDKAIGMEALVIER